jgi:hypothetical protein
MAVAAVAACFVASAALAQPEDDKMRLFRYYIVQVAIDVCEIDVPKGQQARFDKACDVLEDKIGETKKVLDDTFKQIKTGATQNPRGFCDQYKPVANKTLAEFK